MVKLGVPDFVPFHRLRQEALAHERISHRHGRQLKLPQSDIGASGVKGQTVLSIQMKVVQEISYKHAEEREVR